MHTLLNRVFEQLNGARISYCLLRGYDELDIIASGDDVDLLIHPRDIERVRILFKTLGFVYTPSWGRGPHQFYIAYDECSDVWLKLDVVTELMYGKPIPSIVTDLANTCLLKRERRGPTYVPSAEDEFVSLLLHCVLDKNAFSENRQHRLVALRIAVANEEYLTRLLHRYWSSSITWPVLAQIIDRAGWNELLAQRPHVIHYLTQNQRLATLARNVSSRLLRKADRFAGAIEPRSLSIALLAPDGGGKTTLANQLAKTFFLPSRYIYMGTNIEASTVGFPTTRWITAHSRRPSSIKRLPLWMAARGLRFVNNAFEQWYRYGVSYYHLVRGRLVLFDRFTYDSSANSRGKRSLKSRARRWLLNLAAPKPNLIVFLDAPGDVLYARKGEHTPELLEQQRQQYLQLRDQLPQMVVVDATSNADQVRRTVTSLIWRKYGTRVR